MHSTTSSSVWRMADVLAGGRLAAIITEHRDAGRSLNDISRQLHADYGIEVSGQTIANWLEADE